MDDTIRIYGRGKKRASLLLVTVLLLNNVLLLFFYWNRDYRFLLATYIEAKQQQSLENCYYLAISQAPDDDKIHRYLVNGNKIVIQQTTSKDWKCEIIGDKSSVRYLKK